ncbi:putative endoplasmic reticulum resident protein 27 [Triplophysa rosa]|uniref:Endoplasmic reticulum resident protein 27 n=1 Tax=Triplophysa rosa TaxID=992332 RepID=A0A9W7WSW6_TRIRA|nr:putative endoplasmic reticulum resident protein 27 [Triplophysa rosa]
MLSLFLALSQMAHSGLGTRHESTWECIFDTDFSQARTYHACVSIASLITCSIQKFLAAVKQIESLSVAVCGEKEVWAKYNITSDTISIFRKADVHQKHLQLSEAKTIDADGLVRFFTINNIHYITEYNQASAVGLFQSEVKTHLLLIVNRDTSDFNQLKEKLGALAPRYTGKMLFVLVNGREKSNARVLEYFNMRSRDLPRIAIYDGHSDRKWLMPKGEISAERVQNFCDSYLSGDLQKQSEAETSEDKTEL